MNIQTEQITNEGSESVASEGTVRVAIVNSSNDNGAGKKIVEASFKLFNAISGENLKGILVNKDGNPLPVGTTAEFNPPILRKYREIVLQYRFEDSTQSFEVGPYKTGRNNRFMVQFELNVRHINGTLVDAKIYEEGPARMVTPDSLFEESDGVLNENHLDGT